MTWTIMLLLGSLAGLALGVLFFGGLWWTTQRLVTSSRPALVVAASLLIRTGGLAIALVALARQHVGLLLGAVIGIVIARFALTRAALDGRLPQVTSSGNGAEIGG